MAPSKSSRSRSDDAPATADDAAAARSSSPAPPAGDDDGGAAREEEELRRGPWTVDEDLVLVNYITGHGEGRWNSLAQAAGLKRTGKSCRLRWLNYLRPDVKRGNFTADEQLLILDLHSRYGNRWSKIAQHLPGRTDNEIKNYWRTRVQKHAKQLNCDAGSERFKDAMRYLWMPHLVDDVDRGRPLLHAAERQLQAAVAGDQLDGYDCYYAAAAALSGTGVTSSSSDSFATASESYDAFPAGKWERPSSSSLDDAGGLYAAGVRAGEVLLSGGGGEWAQAVNQQGLWPEQGAAQVVDGGGAQLEDAELSGWVQNFSTAENFWTLEGI